MRDLILIAFGEGDRSLGDGTFNAELKLSDCALADDPEYVNGARELYAEMLSTLWDLGRRHITVMTKEEFELYTQDDEERPHPGCVAIGGHVEGSETPCVCDELYDMPDDGNVHSGRCARQRSGECDCGAVETFTGDVPGET